MLSALRKVRLLRQLTLYDIRARTGIAVSKLSLVDRGIEEASEDEKKDSVGRLVSPSLKSSQRLRVWHEGLELEKMGKRQFAGIL